MKKRVMLAVAVILLCAATGAFASGLIGTNAGSEEKRNTDIIKDADTVISEKMSAEKQIESSDFDTLSNYIGYDTFEKFSLLHDLLIFMGQYCTTEEEYALVRDMVLEGCDVKTVMDIYQFYLTTNEDVSIVRDIYDMVWQGEEITRRSVVFENAFNKLTDNKCGVLNGEDIERYLEAGFSVDDIQAANVLSRKGVMTIQEIMSELENGTSFEKIVEKISGEKIANADIEEYSLVNTMYTARITGKKIAELVSDTAAGEEYFDDITKRINKAMIGKGYWKAAPSENTEKIISDAANKGISQKTVMALLDSGYSEVDVINAIHDKNCSEKTITAIVREEAAE